MAPGPGPVLAISQRLLEGLLHVALLGRVPGRLPHPRQVPLCLFMVLVISVLLRSLKACSLSTCSMS